MNKILRKSKYSPYACLFLVAIVAILAILALQSVARSFFSLDPQTKSGILTGSFAIAAAITTYIFTKNKEIREAHREKKVEVYDSFLKFVSEFTEKMRADSSYSLVDDADAKKALTDLQRNVVLYSSPDVIRAYNKFTKGNGSDNSLIRVDNLYRAIRNDIGLSNRMLESGELILVFINDIDTARGIRTFRG